MESKAIETRGRRSPTAGILSTALFVLLLGTGARAAADGELVYVSNRDSGEISILATADNTVLTRLAVGEKPTYSAVTPDGSFAFAVATGDRRLVVVDTAAGKVVAKLPLGDSPKGVEVTPDGRFVLVANEGEGSNSVSIFSVGDWKQLAEVPVGKAPHNIAFARGIAYIANGGSADVSKIDLATAEATGTIALDDRGAPHNLAATPDGKLLFVARKGSDDVAVIDLEAEKVVEYIPVSKGHHAVAVSPDGRTVYVSGIGSNVINVIDVASLERTGEIPVGEGPHGVRFSPDGDMAYVAVAKSDRVAVIDTEARKVVSTIADPGFPFWLAVAGN